MPTVLPENTRKKTPRISSHDRDTKKLSPEELRRGRLTKKDKDWLIRKVMQQDAQKIELWAQIRRLTLKDQPDQHIGGYNFNTGFLLGMLVGVIMANTTLFTLIYRG